MSVEIIDHDLGEAALVAALRKARGSEITVGIHGDETTRDDDGPLTNAQLAAFHEFGTATIPARPFLGGTFDARRDQVGKILDQAATALTSGPVNADKVLDAAAIQLAAEVKAYMASGIDPALGPAAVKARQARLGNKTADNNRFGGDKPLILSGQLRQSVAGKAGSRGGEQ